MRILEIRLGNLNSLLGEWTIDLTQPSFTQDGLFAITGPTGAGKSTILDAICLALYGATPRLGKISKSNNEVMSRRCGECHAEVTFETPSGRYRCHWSQRRAHRKPSGELQQPRHEISDALTGQVIETKLRRVGNRIEHLSGMDFGRFTRSMLLAQGGFSVFLDADPAQRAPILEQITGTAIYSEISIRVHERTATERRRLEALETELAGMRVLTVEEERCLHTRLEELEHDDKEHAEAIDRVQQALIWLDGIVRLEQEVSDLRERMRDCQTRRLAFEPDRIRLQRASQALELGVDHALLRTARDRQANDLRQRATHLERRPSLVQTVLDESRAQSEALAQMARARTEREAAAPRIGQAKRLDLQIAEKAAPLAEAAEQLTRQQALLDESSVQLKANRKTRDDAEQALLKARSDLEETRSDDPLIDGLSGIQERFRTLRGLSRDHRQALDAVHGARTEADSTRLDEKQRANSLQAHQQALAAAESASDSEKSALLHTLQGRSQQDWRLAVSTLAVRQTGLEKLGDALRSAARSRQTGTELGQRLQSLDAEQTRLTHLIEKQSASRGRLERNQNELQRALLSGAGLRGLEEARQHLEDGSPCPLCGALEHPYLAGGAPQTGQTGRELDAAASALKTCLEELADSSSRWAATGSEARQVRSRLAELAGEESRALSLATQCADELKIGLPDQPELEPVERLREQTVAKLARASAVLADAEVRETALRTLGIDVDREKSALESAQRVLETARHRSQTASQALRRCEDEAAAAADRHSLFLTRLALEMAAFGVDELSMTNLDRVEAQLQRRCERRKSLLTAAEALERTFADLCTRTHHQALGLEQTEATLVSFREQLQRLQSGEQALRLERKRLFGDLDPLAEEARLEDTRERAHAALEDAEKRVQAARRALQALDDTVAALSAAIGTQDLALQDQERSFLERLGQGGFASESDYLGACLPESERKALGRQAEQLAAETSESQSLERERSSQLELQRLRRVTSQPRETLAVDLETRLSARKEIQQWIGGVRRQLADNQALRERQREKADAISAQRLECVRWQTLHALIGSADGKKFRNFAQGLTFEMMIAHANRQLEKMSDRYLLINDPSEPLELNVVDNYQAGEIRSTRNLSGGEGFIVSLSLALGLSQMASRNVRVDSLFLDEGFGTLDEDALDTALDTLAGLHQQGKLIGVISHVPALKERIATQISVIPGTGGTSRISGPGCSGSG